MPITRALSALCAALKLALAAVFKGSAVANAFCALPGEKKR